MPGAATPYGNDKRGNKDNEAYYENLGPLNVSDNELDSVAEKIARHSDR